MTHAKFNIVIRSLWPILLPFLVFVLHALLFRSWIVDDAGVSFAYARNFIHGHGFVAQAGVEPVEGFSNPLWTLLVSPFFIADPVNPTVSVKLMSMGLVLGAFAFVAAISRCIFGLAWWARVVTAAALLLTSVNTSFVVWTTSGLENPLYAFLAALYCWLSIMYATGDRLTVARHRSDALAAYAGLAAAGLALTRPDGLIFLAAFPGVLAIRVANDVSQWKTEGKRLLVFLIAALVPIAAYLVFRVAYFGDLYPNTYHAKGGPSALDVARLAFLTKDYIDKTYDLLYGMFSWRAGLFLVLLMLGLFSLVVRRRKMSAVVALLPILACSWAIYVLLPSDWMGEYRFCTPFFLLLPLVMFAVLADVLDNSPLSSRAQKIVFVTVAVMLLAQSVQVYGSRSLRFAESPTLSFDAVAQEFGIRFNHYADQLGISEASLLAPDLGGTLYFSRHRVYDLAGLCDRQIAHLINAKDTTRLRDRVFSLRPTFIHVHDFWSVRSGFFDDDRFRVLYAVIWETPSKWAEEHGHAGIYSGDYVLRSALPSPELLETLRGALDTSNQQEHAPDEEKALPFPRG